MIDIPGIYVGRFKDDPNQSTMLMKNGDTPTYTDDNWANVESTGTIWRYNAETGEWIDTGLEEILVEEVNGTKEIVAEGTVPWKLQGLNVYGKSTQASTTGAQLFDISQATPAGSAYGLTTAIDGEEIKITGIVSNTPADTHRIEFAILYYPENLYGNIFSMDIIDNTGAQDYGIYTSQTINIIVFYMKKMPIGTEINLVFRLMVNSGPIALPWEPYTGGKPSPSPDYPQEIVTAGSDGAIDITVSDGADQSQQLSIQTPNGLPGIPVDSGGNYTDADGQQWVCDEVDFEKGVYVQQVGKVIIDGTTLSFEVPADSLYWNLPGDSAPHAVGTFSPTLITHFPYGVFRFNPAYDFMYTSSGLMSVYFETADDLNQFCVKENSKGNPLTVYYIYDEPQETPLSAEELAAYAALRSYDDRTIISTDEDVSGMSAKVVTDVISKNAWFDPYAELALYYKALAGFASLEDLPMPHSRESSLVRKLLDSSYELGFTVTENSSRNERYLWDLINGTTSMLANVPKSDTEKFLHVMIGGTVEEYPTVDTELDYWMDKCVNYMSSNGNI